MDNALLVWEEITIKGNFVQLWAHNPQVCVLISDCSFAAREFACKRRRYRYVADWRVCGLYIVVQVAVEEGEKIAVA